MKFSTSSTIRYIDPRDFKETYESLESSTIIKVKGGLNIMQKPRRILISCRSDVIPKVFAEDIFSYLVTNDERRRIRALILLENRTETL